MPSGVYKHSPWSPDVIEKIRQGNLGRKRSAETCARISAAKKLKPTNYWLGKKRGPHSAETKAKMSNTHKKIGTKPPVRVGAANNKWKGGISKGAEYRHYNNKEYKDWRKQVFERDNYACQECGIRSCKGVAVVLHPHHLKSYTLYPELRYVLENGLTLCYRCHMTRHYGKEIINNGGAI